LILIPPLLEKLFQFWNPVFVEHDAPAGSGRIGSESATSNRAESLVIARPG
jgi:hypothetical protein